MRTKIFSALSLAFCLISFLVDAQTIGLTSTTPTSSTTIGGGTSLFLGTGAGASVTTSGSGNTFMGFQAGKITTSGIANVAVGPYSGQSIIGSSYNIYMGLFAGSSNNSANGSNVMIGHAAGGNNVSGFGNVFLGHQTGIYSTGSSNVLIGSNVSGGGTSTVPLTSNEKLYIDNSNTATPLIWGDFATDQLKLNGKVGIGAVTTFPTTAGTVNVSAYKLFVTGGILTDEVRVNLSSGGSWADYVFAKDYDLKPLAEVEKFINENGHLPNVPSAKQVRQEGIALGEMAKIQQEKIEELMLYLIQQNKEIEILRAEIQTLSAKK